MCDLMGKVSGEDVEWFVRREGRRRISEEN